MVRNHGAGHLLFTDCNGALSVLYFAYLDLHLILAVGDDHLCLTCVHVHNAMVVGPQSVINDSTPFEEGDCYLTFVVTPIRWQNLIVLILSCMPCQRYDG